MGRFSSHTAQSNIGGHFAAALPFRDSVPGSEKKKLGPSSNADFIDCKRPYTRCFLRVMRHASGQPISLRESRISQVLLYAFSPQLRRLNRAKLSDDPIRIPPTRAVSLESSRPLDLLYRSPRSNSYIFASPWIIMQNTDLPHFFISALK